MIYTRTARVDTPISRLGLGGHEYLPDGRSRGFNEDSARAVTPGELFEGFGGEARREVLAAAYRHGINLFDATIDSEKEALGRNMAEMPPPYDAYVQTRPAGMVYNYDPQNRKMAQYDLLRAEVVRCLGLLRRERIDYLNLAFMASALAHDPAYLDRIAANVALLKAEGLIRYACADTFSGEAVYLRQIAQGCFDVVYINLNFADDCGTHRVLPAAKEQGMAVFAREAYLKGALFGMGEEAGILDRSALARAALKWVLAQGAVTAVMVGADVPDHLDQAAAVLEAPDPDQGDLDLLARVRQTEAFRAYAARKRAQFGYG